MSYAQNQQITATDYNTLVSNGTNIKDHWGIGNASRGLGQSTSAIATVATDAQVTATQWTGLLQTINNCLSHQGQTPITPGNVTAGNLITYYPSIVTGSALAYANAGTTGLATIDGATNTTSYTGSATTTTITHVVTFPSGDAARYFFNAGGKLKLGFARTGGTSNAVNTDFSALCTASGIITFGYKNTTKTGGSGTPTILLNSNNGGYWNSSAVYVTQFRQFSTVNVENYVQVEYAWDGIVSNGGAPVLTIRVVFSASSVIDGTQSSTLIVSSPATTYITNTWGIPVYSGSSASIGTAIPITYHITGGGGGGGAAYSPAQNGGGGGGAGAGGYYLNRTATITLGTTINLNIGNGGFQGTWSTSLAGNAGGSTSISIPSLSTLTATGGSGGLGGDGSRAGGAGGSPGGGSGSAGDAGYAFALGGYGGTNGFLGCVGGVPSTSGYATGGQRGGGGGGGSTQSTGGDVGANAGGGGVCILSYPDTYPAASVTGSPSIAVTGGQRIYTWETAGAGSISWVIPTVPAEYLLIAAGGGGVGANAGGGGGGGVCDGVRAGASLILTKGETVNVIIGAGSLSNGANSSIGSIVSIGGGYGFGGNGGSGGGAGPTGAYGLATAGQGYNGGASTGGAPGGGGGAGGVGNDGTYYQAGSGGIGITSSISGSAVQYAGGGGGGGFKYDDGHDCAGANGGGYGAGNGATSAYGGGSGAANTGAGAGGGYYEGSGRGGTGNTGGGSGGSGIAIIRYPDTNPAMTAVTGNPTITVAGGWRVYKWTGSGSYTF